MGVLAAIIEIMREKDADSKKATPETVVALAVFLEKEKERKKNSGGKTNG